jgi:GNAT superfamily N-acetyltransferase
MSLVIRPAEPGDGAAIHAMVEALAKSHGEQEHFTAVAADYETALFAPGTMIGAFIAVYGGVPAGCAIWHRSFSTFRGKETLYLEDLSVLPAFRRRGIARALLGAMAGLALSRGVPAISWLMMPWNDAARKLYIEAGAEIEEGVCLCRLHGPALERLAT